MPTMHKCTFCGREFVHGTGMLFIKKDGTLYWFCSKRCRVFMLKHKKDSRKIKWTAYYGQERRA